MSPVGRKRSVEAKVSMAAISLFLPVILRARGRANQIFVTEGRQRRRTDRVYKMSRTSANCEGQSMKNEHGTMHITPADGNIFADLGFPPEEAARLLWESDLKIDAEIAAKTKRAKGTSSKCLSIKWRLTEVSALNNFRVRVHFVDGLEGVVDMSGLVHSPAAGVFGRLADPDLFKQVFVEHGAVTWPGELDLAPDVIYYGIRTRREWILK